MVDDELVDRVRAALADHAVREVAMFGGLAFLVDERMVACVSTGGSDLLVRVAPEDDAGLLQRPGASRAEMGSGRSMGVGWIAVERGAVAEDADLGSWVAAALAFHAQGSGRRSKPRAR